MSRVLEMVPLKIDEFPVSQNLVAIVFLKSSRLFAYREVQHKAKQIRQVNLKNPSIDLLVLSNTGLLRMQSIRNGSSLVLSSWLANAIYFHAFYSL